jgi:hypothetical protein
MCIQSSTLSSTSTSDDYNGEQQGKASFKAQGPSRAGANTPPLPLIFLRNCPFTCLTVDKEEQPLACICHECSLWYNMQSHDWSIERHTCLVCKGGHKEDEVEYINKYEWAHKKPDTSIPIYKVKMVLLQSRQHLLISIQHM